MPLYEIHTSRHIREAHHAVIHRTIAVLHANTFGHPPATIRSDFITQYQPNLDGPFGHRRQGGIAGRKSDYIVVKMAFTGKPEQWADYCRRLIEVYDKHPEMRRQNRKLWDVYLVRVEFEYNREFGLVVDGGPTLAQGSVAGDEAEQSLPAYQP